MNSPAAADDTPYALLGGDAGVRRLVDRFYDLMDAVPEYHGIRKLHPQDLAGSREKLYLFLSGWLGGPPLYVKKHGHPMLRARHLPFAIGIAERDAWLACMLQAMEDSGVEEPLRTALLKAFFGTADWMRNRNENGAGGR
ncbi:MAG: group II truncated hemoglobin [Burkholderiales bacterium]